MDLDLKSLPDDARLPKEVVISLIETYQEKIHYLEEQLRLFKNELFGRSSEKREVFSPDQMPLFHRTENQNSPEPQPIDKTIVIASHARKTPGRKLLPKDLPRIDIIHDIPEEQKHCGCGAQLSRIGEEVCEKLDYIPAQLRVLRKRLLKPTI